MKLPKSSTLLKPKLARDYLLFTAISDPKFSDQNYFTNFNDECIVISHGIGEHSKLAARIACDTAIWAYKLVRLRNYYWEDKKLLLKRIIHTTNLTLWQKQRETGYQSGVYACLLICITSGTHYWLATMGELIGLHIKNNHVVYLNQNNPSPTQQLGFSRHQPSATIFSSPFALRETLIFYQNSSLTKPLESYLLNLFCEPIQTTHELSGRLSEFSSSEVKLSHLLFALHRSPA